MEPQEETEVRPAIGKIKDILRVALRLNWFISCCAALLLFIIIRTFFLELYRLNSRDMQSTWSEGDIVLLRKFNTTYSVHDVIAFRFMDTAAGDRTFLQRIVAMPGDTFELRSKFIYINSYRIADTSSVRHNYFIQTRGYSPDSLYRLRYNLNEGGSVSGGNDYSYALNDFEAFMLKRDSLVKSVAMEAEGKGEPDARCFPHDPDFPWNRDHYGPVYVPRRGDTLRIDSVTIKFYKPVILHENDGDTTVIFPFPFIYRVKDNYYFVLGDNRDNANDSRIYGFVPERQISGKLWRTIKRSGG